MATMTLYLVTDANGNSLSDGLTSEHDAYRIALRAADERNQVTTVTPYQIVGDERADDTDGEYIVEPITDAQIESLSTEAAAAGDLAQVDLCALALDGDSEARGKCARTIRDAQAQLA